MISFDPDPDLEMAVGLDKQVVFAPYLTLAGGEDEWEPEDLYDDAA